MDRKQSIDSLSFEEALQRLEKIIKLMEQGEVPLEQAVTLYEEGHKLQLHCQKKLKTARLKIEKIVEENSQITKEQYNEK